MYTLCPNCQSVHALNAEQLTAQQGQVRCAHCGAEFDALERLSDDYPSSEQQLAKRADAPAVLGVEADRPPIAMPAPLAQPPSAGWPWRVLLGLLALLTVLNLAWTFRSSVAPDSDLAQKLQAWSVPGFEAEPVYRDPSRMHLIARDIHPHPNRSGMLVLSATFTNLSDRAQPYPGLAVTLYDSNNQPLAARLFPAADYLQRTPAPDELMGSREQVPILLEFAEPAMPATGFDLQFR